MTKYKISWVSKHKYNVLQFTEDGEEVFMEVVFSGNLNEAEEFIKEKRK